MSMTDPQTLTDDVLVARIARLTARSRKTTAGLIAHLVELERRGLHHALGFKSLFGYCRHVLHFSEAESYQRMQAAHAARRFPVIVPLLAEGLLHLTAVRLLAPHLENENHLALLGGAFHKSKREVDALLAGWFPRPDVKASVRKLPDPASADVVTLSVATSLRLPAEPAPTSPSAPTPTSRPATVSPLAPARYEFRFTGDEETKDLLREAQELLSHSLPSGDLAAIVKRGLAFVVADARRTRFAATGSPRAARDCPPDTRHIPAHVMRLVWERDGGRCAFVGSTGRRCEERHFLEYHHLKPWIVGGEASAANIALRCRTHNQYEAKVYFAPIRRAMAEGL